MHWEKQSFSTIDELFQAIMALEPGIACRGQADMSWRLLSSLDRILPTDGDYAARLVQEESIFDNFLKLAREYFGRIERKYLTVPFSKQGITALTLLQHYGAPTRLLDWTHSPWIGLYYASIRHHDKDGAVWLFDQRRFVSELDPRWKRDFDMPRRQDDQVDLEHSAFNTDGPNWITMVHCPVPFARLEIQQGFFTVAGRLGLDHGERIADVLDADHRKTFVIPSGWKQEILDRLRSMNIHATTLRYPGADHVGHELMATLKQRAAS